VDRFLEHHRILYFENACQPEVFISSADWMPRNLFRRIEIAFPIEDGNLRERVITEILERCLSDNVKARILQHDGKWRRAPLAKTEKQRRSQSEFMHLAAVEEKLVVTKSKRTTKYPRMKLVSKPAQLAAKRKA
jgi:polyphosphate kinase